MLQEVPSPFLYISAALLPAS